MGTSSFFVVVVVVVLYVCVCVCDQKLNKIQNLHKGIYFLAFPSPQLLPLEHKIQKDVNKVFFVDSWFPGINLTPIKIWSLAPPHFACSSFGAKVNSAGK